MPNIEGKEFEYDPEGIEQAEKYAKEIGAKSPYGKRSGFKMKGWSAFTKSDQEGYVGEFEKYSWRDAGKDLLQFATTKTISKKGRDRFKSLFNK